MEDEQKSEIYGSGYGDKHLWKRGETEQVNSVYGSTSATKNTYYQCGKCGAGFRHYYDNYGEEDIFDAMKIRNAPEECN